MGAYSSIFNLKLLKLNRIPKTLLKHFQHFNLIKHNFSAAHTDCKKKKFSRTDYMRTHDIHVFWHATDKYIEHSFESIQFIKIINGSYCGAKTPTILTLYSVFNFWSQFFFTKKTLLNVYQALNERRNMTRDNSKIPTGLVSAYFS